MLMLIMWSENGLSRTAKKKRLVRRYLFFNKKIQSHLGPWHATEYTQAFQKIQGIYTLTFFFKKISQDRKTITTNSQHPIIGDV